MTRRRWLVPEVIQTSATDCGPAALKSLFAGHGIYLSYGRLREACQTDVDGTSIDTLESLGNALGLAVEQRMLSAELIFLGCFGALPAIAAAQLPDGSIHFIVIWRSCGPWVQIMDPAAGRLWVRRARLLDSLYQHEQSIPSTLWDEWAKSTPFLEGLKRRLGDLGAAPTLWKDATHLDASLRLATALVHRRALHRGKELAGFLERCLAHREQIPDKYWAARPDREDPQRVRVRGAVVLAATGSAPAAVDSLPASLDAVRREAPPPIWAPVRTALRESGAAFTVAIGAAVVFAAVGVVAEALAFRALLDVAEHFPRPADRLMAIGATVAFSATLLALEWASASGLFRLGRQLEARFRAAFLRKVPRLHDRYFQSRLISDMASRAHALQLLRELPDVAGRVTALAFTLLSTTAAIAWLYPAATLPALAACLAAVGVPCLFQPGMLERDLRVLETAAGLSRFSLDALLGTCAIQAHAAERTMMAAQASQLERWADAGIRRQTFIIAAHALQSAASIGCVVWLVYAQAVSGWSSGLLLLVFWAASIPSIGAELASVLWTLPILRNTILRFLEPLTSPGQEPAVVTARPLRAGVAIDIRNASVVAGGHVVLDQVKLQVAPGEHLAIVGCSGSGKSSLVGLLLGWHQPSEGEVFVDGQRLGPGELAALRETTTWVDPQVHLFRSSVFDNVRFGLRSGEEADRLTAETIEGADLPDMLCRLPDGLQTAVGDRGTTLSAAEGQRIRLARAFARGSTRLVIMDEAARGFDRDERRRILATTRCRFAKATLLTITHDIADSRGFDRVVVMHQGRIVESGAPAQLASQRASRYATLLREEESVWRQLWSHPRWRRMQMTDGTIEPLAEESEWTRVSQRT